MVKNLPVKQETQVRYLGGEDPLEMEMATHSSILAWRIPWTKELGPWGCKELDIDWATFASLSSMKGKHTVDLNVKDLPLSYKLIWFKKQNKTAEIDSLSFSNSQFVVVRVPSHVWLFATPWTAAHQASLIFTISQSLLKHMSIDLVMPSNGQLINHLIFPWTQAGIINYITLGVIKRLLPFTAQIFLSWIHIRLTVLWLMRVWIFLSHNSWITFLIQELHHHYPTTTFPKRQHNLGKAQRWGGPAVSEAWLHHILARWAWTGQLT